jgi:diguanylate cyclase (GGDEF)-like protein/putative nucleotidyltransferase with HDIG domain
MTMRLPLVSNKSWQAQILWGVVISAALFAVGVTTVKLAFFSSERLTVLAFASFLSILVGRYHPSVPKTRIKFCSKDIFAFWGVLWIGVSGGLLLAALSSVTSVLTDRENKDDRPYTIAADVLAVYAGATIFYLALGYLPYTQGRLIAGDLEFSEATIGAIGLMVATHYLVRSSLNYLIERLDGILKITSLLVEQFVLPLAACAASLLATAVFYITFLKFGIEFGMVVIPIVVIGDLAYRLHIARLAQKTKQIMEASRVHLATVEALATAIDARDQVGIGHVRRTQIYAIGVGELLGLSESEINALRTGALLHDIGKLAVPDHILNKPGRLTQAEMEKTKIHASVGASILEKVGFEYPVVPTVKHHHECWDGSGYPEGLKGNKIPLTARILSVADAYDTLRGARPYRPPVARDEACNLLISGAGAQFDPKVVSVFLKNLHAFETRIEAQGLAYALESDQFQHISDAELDSENLYLEQIKRANREIFTLYELARDFSSSVNLHETLAIFTDKISTFVPFNTCSVFLLEEGGEYAIPAHTTGRGGLAFKGRRVKIGEGPTGEVLSQGVSLRHANPHLDFTQSQHDFVEDYVTMMSLPLVADGKLIGAVSLYSSDLLRYEEEHLRLLETISKIAADAIQKSQRHLITETYALTDPMTGLPNARSLQIQFDKEVARCQRTGSTFQVLMLDLDGFKAVNDTFGHKAGDKMLKEIGNVILGQLREYDFLSRYAGDEFVALVNDAGAKDVEELCGRIEKAVCDFVLPISIGKSARVGVSLGAASYPKDGTSFDEIIVSADKGMYARKSTRKNDLLKAEARPPAIGNTETASVAIDLDSDVTIPAAAEPELPDDAYVVELDETHIVSSAVN